MAGTAEPNKSVKGTRRPLAVLKFGFFIKARRLRFAFVGGAPLTVTLGFSFSPLGKSSAIKLSGSIEVFMKKIFLLVLLALSTKVAYSVPYTIDLPIDMSLSNNRYCVASYQCTDGWSFWQYKTGAHVPNGGIGEANDTYAWDINLNSPFDYDAGKPVRAVEAGTIYTGNGWGGSSFGQVLISHSTGSDKWSTGYLHMTRITKKSGTVKKGDIIGYISNIGVPNKNNHLHFVVYKDAYGSSSVNVNFSGKTATPISILPTGVPTLSNPISNATNVSTSGVNFTWNAAANATNYRIVISQNSSFSGFVENGGNSYCDGTCFTIATNSTSYWKSSLNNKGYKYYWKVRASGNGGTSAWSTSRSFTTAR